MNYILSLCNADIFMAHATWVLLREKDKNCMIVTDKINTKNVILRTAYEDNNSSPGFDDIKFTKRPFTIPDDIESAYLFTLGTLPISRFVLKCIELQVPIFYNNSYACFCEYRSRLAHPLPYMLKYRSSALCIPNKVLAQLARQMRYDPFYRKLFFSADLHCWLREHVLHKLNSFAIEPSIISKRYDVPEKTLVFVLGGTERPEWGVNIDWEVFIESSFNLTYKPHPLRTSCYDNYPTFVKPIESNESIEAYRIPASSFLIGFFSHALALSNQSISIADLYHRSIPKDLDILASCASYRPANSTELKMLLQTFGLTER